MLPRVALCEEKQKMTEKRPHSIKQPTDNRWRGRKGKALLSAAYQPASADLLLFTWGEHKAAVKLVSCSCCSLGNTGR